ncbi:LacI family DNA-binding transcriptional regulator [Luteolibacter sp. LG18]|uniref:LacI family DNA-binding transcriptional regulator n=1 Tax=Luteolibacter sp. LG18 TaxID=2819286 RepID=UPI002B2E8430|nr:LacI family transcriptional regulator [Luteolibacter sp. LG18]
MPDSRLNTTEALAKHLGISRWTVSRVLNGHEGVKPETVRRVRQAIEELDFQPSALARGLRGGQTATIGVCFQDLDSPILAMRAAALQQQLREQGYHTVIELSGAGADLERHALRRFVAQHVDGIVLIFSRLPSDDPVLELLEREKIPSFWVDPENAVPGDKVTLNRSHSMKLVLEHLAELGHRRIALLGIDPLDRFGSLRMPGLKRHAPKVGLDFERDFLSVFHPGETRQSFDYGRELAAKLIATAKGKLPTAIIALNDRIAIGIINRLREEGIRVPEDVSVVGHDNIAVAEHFHPPLTTVDQQTDRLMHLAVRGLLDRLEPGAAPSPGRSLTVQPRLVVRNSTAPARG